MPMPTTEQLRKAIKKAIESSPRRNFKQSVELIVVFKDVDPKSPEGRIRETIVLPRGRGKDLNICVVADGEMAIKARELGAARVISGDELRNMSKKDAKKVAETCDWVLVKADLMALAGRVLGPALGPRGKIPVPVPPTADISVFIKRYKSAVLARTKDQPQVMVPIGTEDMSLEDLVENAQAVLSTLETKLPNGAHNIGKVIVKTTMGPPIPVVG
ncbi:MAG: 50S ribosomal protein L1 [Thermoprotei archaeon]